jgi:hypothetical protein
MPRVPRVPKPPAENPVGAIEQLRAVRLLQRLGLDPFDVDFELVVKAAVIQRLVEALVGVLVADVLADDVNREPVFRVLDPLDQRLP